MSDADLLTECDREPIQMPGAVQGHGALLGLERDTLRVTHASANLEAFIGIDAAAALGGSAATLLGDELAALVPYVARARQAGSNATGIDADLARGRVRLLPFHTQDGYGIDVFRERPADAEQSAPLLAQHVIQSLRLSRSSEGLFRIAVNDVRRITGYDRVMVYRFDDDGSGDIIAENHAPGIESFLGLRYPANDIPQQARRLYMVQRVRVIVDVSGAPVVLLAAPGGLAADLDLSASWLRAVSPVHLQYLSNMGVAASAVVSLIVAGRLWGMLVCHHNSAREISADQRAQLELIGQVMSGMLGSLLQMEMSAMRQQRKRALSVVTTALANADPAIGDAFAACGRDLVNLIAADGVVITVADRTIEVGHTPAPQALRTIRATLSARPSTDAASWDRLSDALKIAPQELDGFAGALLLPLPACAGGSILWLRRELHLTVNWAGNPQKPAPNPRTGRLEPRESFATWREIVRGRSVPWTEADMTAARDLRKVTEAALGQRSASEFRPSTGDHDALTGLLNRQTIEGLLNTVTEMAVEPPRALAILNIDRFRHVEEQLGRSATDALLVQIAQRLQATAKPGDLVARMGPDEFGVLSTTGLAHELAARLTAVFSQSFGIANTLMQIHASVGVADNAPLSGHTRDLLRSAESAMRQVKLAGGGRVSIFAEVQADEASRRVLVEQSLDAALSSDPEQFQLALQPIVDAGSGVILSWEVLIRWSHPLLGNISPAEFIPIAESSGLIEAVGDLVMEASLRHLVEVPPSVELVGSDVSLSVNVSPLQLTRPGFAAEIGAMLDARGIAHGRLCLEVTEAVFSNPEAVATITAIRRLGVQVAIDAFGIGNSSLSNLQQLPADVVKLDRSFLPAKDEIITGGRSFLTAIVALAHAADLRVVVEGVENQAQLNAVVTAGADAVQGYLLGVPMSTEDAVAIACQRTEERTWQPKFEEAALLAANASLVAESPGILERLRGATRSAHASIETVPRFGRLQAPDLAAADYVETLRRLHAFHAPIESAIAQCLSGNSVAEALLDGSRLAAITADIAWFGAVPLEPQRLPEMPTSVASALGALYVIEGSNLGARVIGRQVAKTLGVGPGTGGSYHCGLTAEDARRRWRLLQDLLRLGIDESGAPCEPVIAAALDTFAALEQWMGESEAALAQLAS